MPLLLVFILSNIFNGMLVFGVYACIIAAPTGGSIPVINSNQIKRVVLVLEENTAYGSVVGQPCCPYFNSLANTNGLATLYYGTNHPSIGNYFWLTAAQVISTDNAYDPGPGGNSSDNIVRHMIGAGKTWKEYCESRPSVGYIGNDVYPFIQHHCPLGYYSDVRGSQTQLNNLVDFPQFTTDLNASNLPTYSFVVPNQLNNAHDGPLSTADTWLQTNIKPLINNQLMMQNTLIFLLFDESVTADAVNGGGHVYWAAIGPQVNPTYQSTFNFHNHGSTARLSLQALGMPINMSGAATASDMGEFLNNNFKATGTVNVAFNYKITATNNPTSFGATNLPAGLSVNTVSGLISGTPTVAGNTNVTMNAINGFGTGSQTLAVAINPAGALNGFYVATNGLDSNNPANTPGQPSLSAPFLTLTRAKQAMEATATKITYVRAGNYVPPVLPNCDGGTDSCLLDLQHTADGVTYSYYPPDGYNSASISGGSSSVGTGAYNCVALHANSVTIDGLHIHHCQYSIFRTTGGSINGTTIKNSELNNQYIPETTRVSGGAISCYGCSNFTVSHNYIHDLINMGVVFSNVNGTVTNMLVDSNFFLNTCTGAPDCGTVYLFDGAAGQVQTATNTRWTNNYVRDGQVNAGAASGFGQVFYTDDCASDVVVSGNVISGKSGSNGANIVHGGKNVRITNNLIDLSTFQGKISTFQTSSANITCPDASMSGNQIEDNIIIGTGPGGGYQLLSGTPQNKPTIINNDYFPYAGGALNTGGAYSDLNVSTADPILSGWEYIIGASSVLNAPVSFFDLCRTWGPPGFVVPRTGTPPSSPHP